MSDERREVHEAANIFPKMNMDDIAGLADDIEANGLREPIELLDGKIIDGRNREWACRIAGVEPEYVDIEVRDAVGYVMSKNLHRRHLTTGQRAMVAAKVRDLYAAQAKERQRLSKGRGKKKVGKDLHTNKGKARDQAGKALGVSGVSVDKATKVLRKGTPELVEAVTSGSVSLEKAVQKVKTRRKTDPVTAAKKTCQEARTQVHELTRALNELNKSLRRLKKEERRNVIEPYRKLMDELEYAIRWFNHSLRIMVGQKWFVQRTT